MFCIRFVLNVVSPVTVLKHLHQLRKMVEAGVSQNDLQQILNQLRTLMRSNVQSSALPPPPPVHPQQWSSTSYPTTPASMPLPPPAAVPVTFNATPAYPLPNLKSETYVSANLSSGTAPTPIPTIAMAGSSTQTPDFAGLLSSLMKAGVVTANSAPTGAGATARDDSTADMLEAVTQSRETARAYRKSVLSHSAQLTAAAITKYALLLPRSHDINTNINHYPELGRPSTIYSMNNLERNVNNAAFDF